MVKKGNGERKLICESTREIKRFQSARNCISASKWMIFFVSRSSNIKLSNFEFVTISKVYVTNSKFDNLIFEQNFALGCRFFTCGNFTLIVTVFQFFGMDFFLNDFPKSFVVYSKSSVLFSQ